MPQSMERFLTMLSTAFCNDALSQMSLHFTYPLPLYTKGELLVFGAPTALVEALAVYRNAALAADVARISPRVVASGLPQRRYSNQWVEWDHFDSNDDFICTSQVRYAIFQDENALHPKIEMVDYTSLGFPEVSDNLPLMKSA